MPTKPRYLDKPTRDALTAIHGPTWPSMAPKALAEAIRRIRLAPRATFPRRTN